MKREEIDAADGVALGDGKGDSQPDLRNQLAEQRRENKRLEEMLSSEKARVVCFEKKLKFIQDNQDMFNRLKRVHASIKSVRNAGGKNAASQTEKWIGMRRDDLAEVKQLVQAVSAAVDARAERLAAMASPLLHHPQDSQTEMEQLRRLVAKLACSEDTGESFPGLTEHEALLVKHIAAEYAPSSTPYATPRCLQCVSEDAATPRTFRSAIDDGFDM